MASECQITPNRTTIHPRGEIDISSVDAFRDQLRKAMERSTNCIVDMTDVTFLDSSGLSELVVAHSQLTPGGTMVLRHPPICVRRVLRVSGLDTVFTIED